MPLHMKPTTIKDFTPDVADVIANVECEFVGVGVVEFRSPGDQVALMTAVLTAINKGGEFISGDRDSAVVKLA